MLIDLLRAGEDTPELRAAISDALRALWEARGNTPPPPQTPTRNFPCPHEGEVIEPCTSGCGRQWRDVHVCLYEGHDFDRCVRGASANAEIQSCSRCGHHPDAKAGA